MRPTVIIVDAFSSGSAIAPCCRTLGFDCIHLKTRIKFKELYENTFRPADFIKTFGPMEFSDLLGKIREHNIVDVIPGIGSGIELSYRLKKELGIGAVTDNDTYSLTNKCASNQKISKIGGTPDLQTIHILENETVAESLQHRLSFPNIVKPVAGDGGMGIQVCNDAKQTFDAIQECHSLTANMYGDCEFDRSVLIQNFLSGKEFVAITIGHDCRHSIHSLWYSEKRLIGNNPVRNYLEPAWLDKLTYEKIEEVCEKALNSIGYSSGIANTDLILYNENVNVLEVNTRLPGGFDPIIYSLSGMENPVLSYLYKEDQAFDRSAFTKDSCKHTRIISVADSGKLDSRPAHFLSEIQKLESFVCIANNSRVTEESVTKDLRSMHSNIYLAAEDKKIIEADTVTIRMLEDELML